VCVFTVLIAKGQVLVDKASDLKGGLLDGFETQPGPIANLHSLLSTDWSKEADSKVD